MAGMDSIVGSGSDMPIDMYLRKIEQTDMYESPSQLSDFHRETLKDMTPLPALFESDQIRGGRDSNGNALGNPLSQQFLDMRDSGRRSTAEPYLPEGSFTDWQFLEQDPRGTANGPDMKKHVEQQYARADLIKQFPDNDDSVMEDGVNPYQMQMNIRNAQNVTKDYFKIFSTARDGWTNGSIAPGYSQSKKELLAPISGEVKDPVHAANRNRLNVTNNLSNDTSIGWRRTTDNMFSVAKYGKENSGKSFTNDDWYKNRANAHIDHDVQIAWQGTNMSKSMALLMMDISKRKRQHHNTGMQNIDWYKSEKASNKQRKLAADDIASITFRKSKYSQPAAPNISIKGDISMKSGARLIMHDAPMINKTQMNATIVEKMSSVNKNFAKKQRDDLRLSIKQTASDEGLYKEENNSKHKALRTSNDILWGAKALFKKGISKSVFNFKSAKKKSTKHNLERVSKDHFEDDTQTNLFKSSKRLSKRPNNQMLVKTDVEYAPERDRSKSVGGAMGSKDMFKYMDRDGDRNDINDQ